MGRIRTLLPVTAAVLLFGAGCASDTGSAARTAPAATPSADRSVEGPGAMGLTRLEDQVRHELVMLPYYGVFDNLAFRVENGDTVRLLGQVVRPTLKSSAENVVRNVEGVERVINDIEVLPVSFHDDRIRRAAYRAIYGYPGLDRYALQPVPPIHIIVKNGDLTLEGVVASEMDRNLANIRANGVSGVFSVTNNLRVSPS